MLMSKDLKFSKQWILVKNKANLILVIINRGVSYKPAKVISKLYRSYIRPHLEYCIQFWSPINAKAFSRYAEKDTEKTNRLLYFCKV